MPREIPKAYEPREIEERWAKAWFDEKLFGAEASRADSGKVFSIALPPPNVTGSIHIGHMLEHTQIDMLVRWHRMRGDRTLWLPGMDHAGIATQFVVERMLAKEGIKRQNLGREEFERRVWKWKAESGGVIKEQMIRLGASCDWTRERFTLEPALYRAVLEAFLRLYREGLIYRGRYMVNWCPRCQTAISDLEVVHHERTGEIWRIRYPLVAPSDDPDRGKPGFRSAALQGGTLVTANESGPRTASAALKDAHAPEFRQGTASAVPKLASYPGALASEVPGGEYLVVATTRPETMLGDTALAVHPDDERYKKFIGRKVLLPLMNREIPVIADTYVDRDFGTGIVKITPAHDPNDFEIGKRHHLPEIDVMTEDGHINEAGGPYAGLERFAARGRIVKDLEALGLLEGVKDHMHAVGACDRCKSLVEPRISTQWFCKMKPLAEPAKKVVLDGLIEVVPDNQRAILLNWLENIRDWCISRQLWWGHRIPIWHCADCKEMVPAADSRVEIVDGHARAASAPTTCPKCGSAKLEQDKDVLDTWFSSALWPFSTLGWPDDTPDLRAFYPTSLLISGYDILFFWDARMIMMGLHLMNGTNSSAKLDSSSAVRHGTTGFRSAALQGGIPDLGGRSFSSHTKPSESDEALAPEEMSARSKTEPVILSEAKNLSSSIPFHRLYLHSLVRTAEGAKMSKTKGTGIDPLQLTQQYGTDALRYMLASMSAPGTDIILSEDRILGARAFANKIWNAARFLFFNLEKAESQGFTLEQLAAPDIRDEAPYDIPASSGLAHRWIFSRLASVAAQVDDALEHFRFHEACQTIYHFFWGDFCDWYIEWVKPQLSATDPEIAVPAWRNIFAAFDAALRLLHPVMPFLTEELWHRLPQRAGAQSIALDRFPEPPAQWTDAAAEEEMALLQEIIIAARNIRAEMKLDPKRRISAELFISNPVARDVVRENIDPVRRLASLSGLIFSDRPPSSAGSTIRSTALFEIGIAHGDALDKDAEIGRLKKDLARLEKDIASKQNRLADQNFRNKAPEKVVAELEVTMVERQLERKKAAARLKQLE
ncbi:MAG: valine--tRNA ligase [Candidatus Acidiferrales bacterium]